MATLDENQDFTLKYKWEFCRRDPDVVTRWDALSKLRAARPNGKSAYLSDNKTRRPPETNIEWELFTNCGFPLIDPNISYGDIELLKNTNKFAHFYFIQKLKKSLGNSIFQITHMKDFDYNSTEEPLTLLMKIDFSRPVNAANLKEEFSNIVSEYIHAKEYIYQCQHSGSVIEQESETLQRHIESQIFRNVLINSKNIKLTQRPPGTSDYDKILKAGDMYYKFDGVRYVQRDKKITQLEIARALYPEDFEIPYMGNQPAKTQRITQLCKHYRELVNGGWRGLVV